LSVAAAVTRLPFDTSAKESYVSDSDALANPSDQSEKAAPSWAQALGRIGVDWWATIVAGAIVLLAVAGLLPKIGW
jgi:hypothetical protein